MEDKNLPADFRLYVNVCRNRKTRRMIRDLGVESFYSLVALWCYATENCPDGNLGDPSTSNFATDLADACYWPEDRADEWIAYLVKARWLDAKDGHLLVHDWMLMQPWLSTRLSRSLAGKKGGLKAATKMTDAQLAERAKRAADARWNKASDAKQMLSDAKQHAKPHPNPSHPIPLASKPQRAQAHASSPQDSEGGSVKVGRGEDRGQAQVRQRPKVRRQVTDWEQVKAVLKPEISERAFAKFIQTAKYLGETDEPPCLVLHCADKYSADYIFHNLRWQLVGAVKAVTGQDLGVVVDWDEEQAA